MIDLADDDLAKIQTVAMEAALHVSDFILASFRTDRLIQDEKSDGSPVTQIDREAELRVRNFIGSSALNKWPIVGEEFGGATEGARFRWLIDPIDGTFSFIRGLPTFGTIVAFEDVVAGRALVGAIHLPALHETYVAARGRGASCNGTQIRVATDRNFKACLISTADADQFRRADLETEYRVLRSRVRHLRGYADCWSHCMVARGSIDAVVEPYMHRWDFAATEVLVEEAGGRCVARASKAGRDAYDGVFGAPAAVGQLTAMLGF